MIVDRPALAITSNGQVISSGMNSQKYRLPHIDAIQTGQDQSGFDQNGVLYLSLSRPKKPRIIPSLVDM